MEENALNCGHGCCGGVCGGCGSTLELTQQELDLLYLFAQTPFLPVARENDSELPVFLEIDADDAGLFASGIKQFLSFFRMKFGPPYLIPVSILPT